MKFEGKDITENTLLVVNDEGTYYVGVVETVDNRGSVTINWKDLTTDELWQLNHQVESIIGFLNGKLWGMAKNDKELLYVKLTLQSL
jgi:hypothetical protein